MGGRALRRAAFALVALAGCDAGLPDGVELPTNAGGEHAELVAVGLYEEKCSITAIDVGGDDDAPAYALTAGHCTGNKASFFPEVINLDEFSLGVVRFNVFVDTPDDVIDIDLAERVYSSLDGVDLGLYRLDATIGELRRRGITPIPLAGEVPAVGAPITIAGYPHVTEDDPDRVLHVSACDQGATVTLVEARMMWHDFGASACNSIRPGSSGGPARDDAGRIFGVLSTQAYELDDAPACSLNFPCEVDGAHSVNRPDIVYTAPIRGLAACFAGGVFDLALPDCGLTPPELPVLTSTEFNRGYTEDGARWRIDLADRGLPYYRTKLGLGTRVRCADDAGYGPPIAIADTPTIDDAIPTSPSGEPYILCLQGLHANAPEPATRFLERTVILPTLIP